MLETHTRASIQPALNKLAITLVQFTNITPNGITAIAFISGLGSGCCICFNRLMPALALLMLSGLCDILDGTLARITNTSNKIGAYFDLISDRMVESAVILGFALLYPQYSLAYIIFFITVLLHFSTFVVAGALFPNMGKKSMHYDKSIVERAEAFIVFFAMMLFPAYIYPLLMGLNIAIACAAVSRFFRVLEYARSMKQ